jgi:hypothetical protein
MKTTGDSKQQLPVNAYTSHNTMSSVAANAVLTQEQIQSFALLNAPAFVPNYNIQHPPSPLEFIYPSPDASTPSLISDDTNVNSTSTMPSIIRDAMGLGAPRVIHPLTVIGDNGHPVPWGQHREVPGLASIPSADATLGTTPENPIITPYSPGPSEAYYETPPISPRPKRRCWTCNSPQHLQRRCPVRRRSTPYPRKGSVKKPYAPRAHMPSAPSLKYLSPQNRHIIKNMPSSLRWHFSPHHTQHPRSNYRMSSHALQSIRTSTVRELIELVQWYRSAVFSNIHDSYDARYDECSEVIKCLYERRDSNGWEGVKAWERSDNTYNGPWGTVWGENGSNNDQGWESSWADTEPMTTL